VAFVIGQVSTPAELEAVQRLRYAVYVDEMGRYRGRADHDRQLLAEPEDDHSWIFFARDGDEVVGTARLTWGGDGFSARQIQQYSLQPFLDEIPAERMAVGERGMVLPQYRGTGLFEQLIEDSTDLTDAHDVRVIFGACEPHLLSIYIAMGQRPYADCNINAEEVYLIPLVTFLPDIDAVRGAGYVATNETGEAILPPCIERVAAGIGTITSTTLVASDEYRSEVLAALNQIEQQQISSFDGLSADEVERCLARSNIIEVSAGDRVLKKGGAARNIFVVLEGTLEVRQDDRVIGVLTKGDAFGEMAFLLERPRAFDVYAATDASRVLSLSEGALRKMIAEDPAVAAKVLLNLSKMLCVRLIKAT
jgi:GNAT superfamily N-acetyltransferase